jgi:hypothetical protein
VLRHQVPKNADFGDKKDPPKTNWLNVAGCTAEGLDFIGKWTNRAAYTTALGGMLFPPLEGIAAPLEGTSKLASGASTAIRTAIAVKDKDYTKAANTFILGVGSQYAGDIAADQVKNKVAQKVVGWAADEMYDKIAEQLLEPNKTPSATSGSYTTPADNTAVNKVIPGTTQIPFKQTKVDPPKPHIVQISQAQ